MAKTTWHQRLEEAKRTIELLRRAAQTTSHVSPGVSNIRVASHRNVKLVGNYGHAHASLTAVAHQVAPIHQEHYPAGTAGSTDSASAEGGEPGHGPKEE